MGRGAASDQGILTSSSSSLRTRTPGPASSLRTQSPDSACVFPRQRCARPHASSSHSSAYLVPDQHRPYIEARSITIGNPVSVYFNELADALKQLLLVKVLGGFHRSQGSRFSLPPSALSPRTDWPLTGRQRRLAERSILSMLSQGRKRRTCWSPPL